jgi:GntR family transcriptional regulator / MocR family aminotransferase
MDSDWSSGLDLFLPLDRDHRTAGLGHSIEHRLREAIRAGRLARGTALPSSRSLAGDLGISRGTVSAAYGQLAAEGYLAIRQGAAVRVTWTPPTSPSPPSWPSPPTPSADAPMTEHVDRFRWDFRPGLPSLHAFPRQAWAKAHQAVLAGAPAESFGYASALGSAGLRQALAGYLSRARGVDTDPGRLLICGGFTQALLLICGALRAEGATTLAVEDPSAPRYRQLAQSLGLAVISVPCDEGGVSVDHLARSRFDAVLVTPAHQYPLGTTMSAARRTALVQLARQRHAFIIEDDYDGEFRYDRQPVGALQQLDPEQVIYTGSASKTLVPGLRLGWLSAPRSLIGPLVAARQHLDRGTGILDQLTLAELINAGAFDRHIRRQRTTYRRRRDLLAQALAPRLQLAGISAGLHAVVYLSGNEPAGQLRSRAARQSIAVGTLEDYWHDPSARSSPALVIGYATPADHAYRPALDALTRLLAG